jgi:hypothetical protein
MEYLLLDNNHPTFIFQYGNMSRIGGLLELQIRTKNEKM